MKMIYLLKICVLEIKFLYKFKQFQTVTVRQDNDTYTLFRTSFFKPTLYF